MGLEQRPQTKTNQAVIIRYQDSVWGHGYASGNNEEFIRGGVRGSVQFCSYFAGRRSIEPREQKQEAHGKSRSRRALVCDSIEVISREEGERAHGYCAGRGWLSYRGTYRRESGGRGCSWRPGRNRFSQPT